MSQDDTQSGSETVEDVPRPTIPSGESPTPNATDRSSTSNVTAVTVNTLARAGKRPATSRVLIVGLRDPDTGEDAHVRTIVECLGKEGVEVVGYDRYLDAAGTAGLGIEVQESLSLDDFDGVVLTAPDPVCTTAELDSMAAALSGHPIVVDLTGSIDVRAAAEHGITAVSYWGV